MRAMMRMMKLCGMDVSINQHVVSDDTVRATAYITGLGGNSAKIVGLLRSGAEDEIEDCGGFGDDAIELLNWLVNTWHED